MKKRYKQLSSEERDLIGKGLAEGKSLHEIGRLLGRSTSTISREIVRYGLTKTRKDYLAHQAQRQAERRRSESRRKQGWLKNDVVLDYVKERLRQQWSPELISGRLPLEHPGQSISHESIYQWIYNEAKEYIQCLARKHRRRRKRGYSRRPQKAFIPGRISIAERPKIVELREEAGHWEVDTIFALKSRQAIHVMTERKTRYSKVSLLSRKRAKEVREIMVHRHRRTPRNMLRSFTYDNGSENTCHLYVNTELNTESYFCQPYRSWEKGSVENINGLIRRLIPKGTDLDQLKTVHINKLERWLNARPRKCLSFRTPYEAYRSECCT